MKKWICRDGHSEDVEIEAKDARSAAKKYVDGGEWHSTGEPITFQIWVIPIENGQPNDDEMESFSITRTFPATVNDD